MRHELQILLIEDNPADVRLVQESLSESRFRHTIHIAEDGVAGLQFLRKQGPYVDAATPDIILLDLNLPKKDGREVLLELKNDPELRMIPIIVLTTSDNEQDVLNAYGLHANCYLTKPLEIDSMFRMMHALEEFWLKLVRLPQMGSSESLRLSPR